jgi:hypothetical protein
MPVTGSSRQSSRGARRGDPQRALMTVREVPGELAAHRSEAGELDDLLGALAHLALATPHGG